MKKNRKKPSSPFIRIKLTAILFPLFAALSLIVVAFTQNLFALEPPSPSLNQKQPFLLPSPYEETDSIVEPIAFANFIYWKFQTQLLYAISGLATDDNKDIPITNSGEMSFVKFGYDPGFKVGLGGKLKHGNWDILSRYTYFSTYASSSQPFFYPTNEDLNTQSKKNDWVVRTHDADLIKPKLQFKIDLSQLDLEIGRRSLLSRFLTIRPYLGIKAFIVDSETKAPFVHIRPNDNNILEWNTAKMHSYSPGFGMRGGFQTSWYFIKQLSLFSNIAYTGGWFYHSCDAVEKVKREGNINKFKNRDQDIHRSILSLISEFMLGVRFETELIKGYYLSFEAAFEQQIWDKNALYIVTEDTPEKLQFSVKGLNLCGHLRF